MTQQQRHIAAMYDSNDAIRTMLTRANERQPLALEILRECLKGAKQRLLKAQKAGRHPSMTNFFTGERIAWNWQKRQGGAIEQCLFLATLIYADIARNAAPSTGVLLSQSGLAIDAQVLRDLMRFVATDSHTRFDVPFPYSQNEMLEAFQEHMKHAEKK